MLGYLIDYSITVNNMPERLIEEEKTDTTSRNNQRYNMVNL